MKSISMSGVDLADIVAASIDLCAASRQAARFVSNVVKIHARESNRLGFRQATLAEMPVPRRKAVARILLGQRRSSCKGP